MGLIKPCKAKQGGDDPSVPTSNLIYESFGDAVRVPSTFYNVPASNNNPYSIRSSSVDYNSYNLARKVEYISGQTSGIYESIQNVQAQVAREIEDLKDVNEILKEQVRNVQHLLEQLLEQGQRTYPAEKNIYPILDGKKRVVGYAKYELAA